MRRAPALAALLLALALAQPAEARRFHLPRATHQLVVVTAADWTSQKGELQRWERGDKGGWKAVGDPIAVDLGKAGLGWGLGLQPIETAMTRSGPLKVEGDHRSPAGVFRLLEATGYAAAPPAGTTLKYTQASDRLRCVDDRKSPEYNQLALAPAQGGAAWSSDEPMKRADNLYALAILVEHNRKPVVPGQGSCVFLHVTDGQPTEGCTALPRAALDALLPWLDAAKEPLLVQLPDKDYAALKDEWRLPRPR